MHVLPLAAAINVQILVRIPVLVAEHIAQATLAEIHVRTLVEQLVGLIAAGRLVLSPADQLVKVAQMSALLVLDAQEDVVDAEVPASMVAGLVLDVVVAGQDVMLTDVLHAVTDAIPVVVILNVDQGAELTALELVQVNATEHQSDD